MLRLLHLSVHVIYFVIIDGSYHRSDYAYYKDAGGWLKMHLMPTAWKEARSKCVEEGAFLASPETQNMAAALSSVILTSPEPPAFVYTGIHDTYFKGLFHTVEGTPIHRIWSSWAEGQPDNVGGRESCVTMFRNGKLYDNPCMDAFPFICYKPELATGVNKCGTEDMSYRYEYRTGSCYKFHVIPQAWSHAFATCDREGAHLVIINSDQEALVVKDLFAYARVPEIAHAGFTYTGNQTSTPTWITIHGKTLQDAGYERWAEGEPQQVGTDCGAVFDDGYLDDYYCDVELPFICEMRLR